MVPHIRIVLIFRFQEIIEWYQLIPLSFQYIYAAADLLELWPYRGPPWVAGDYHPILE